MLEYKHTDLKLKHYEHLILLLGIDFPEAEQLLLKSETSKELSVLLSVCFREKLLEITRNGTKTEHHIDRSKT